MNGWPRVLHLAVPELSADLRPSAVELLWIVDVYRFLVAGSLITMGTLGDRIGRRKLLLMGPGGIGLRVRPARGAGSVLAERPRKELASYVPHGIAEQDEGNEP